MRPRRLRLPRPRLRSLRNKLALLFFAITAAAFAVIYFYVVPELQTNLERAKLSDLDRAAATARPALERLMGRRQVTAGGIDRRVRAVADSVGARVTLLGIQQSAESNAGELPEYVISDSREERSVPANADLTADAVLTDRSHSGYIHFAGERLGQVAQPLQYAGRVDWVALYSRSFADVTETVALVRKRVLEAGVAALVIALVGGYLLAQALARRVRRLERGARAVAAGRFVQPLPVDSEDELGTLTRAFNEMQEKLRHVDLARKDFIATASHELRTPIFSLGGFVELLQDEDLDEETRHEFIDAMAEQVARLQKLSVDLLDLSRLDAGSVEFQREHLDLSEVARSVAEEFTPTLAQHRTELRMRLPRQRIVATGDPERVAQIMRILLDNALRHTPEGTPVTVTAQRDNGAAEITVADAGPGLSAETVPHVFERFYTADATSGAGLGLAIARELAERMDGRIALASRPGRTAFTLELPVDRDGATP